jgi:hypothetical protein
MPKNPFYADKVVLKNGGVIETEAGTDIVAVDATGSTVTITGTETVVASEIALANTKILVGNAGGVAAGVTMSGDATIANTGALTIAATAVETSMIALDAVDNTLIADDAVSLENLDSGIEPSHVVKFAGTATWSGSGASLAHTVTGALDTDVVSAVLRVKGTEPSYLVSAIPSANTLTFTVDAANTTNDAKVDYVVYRAAA